MLLSLWNSRVDVIESNREGRDKEAKEDKMSTMVESPPPQLITTIEWGMMDKTKFFPLYTLSSFTGEVQFNNNSLRSPRFPENFKGFSNVSKVSQRTRSKGQDALSVIPFTSSLEHVVLRFICFSVCD